MYVYCALCTKRSVTKPLVKEEKRKKEKEEKKRILFGTQTNVSPLEHAL